MTRFTKDVKRRLVNAIMADVPKTDYPEAARQRALELAVHWLPRPAQQLWSDTSLRGLLETHTLYVHEQEGRHWHSIVSISLPGWDDKHEQIKADPTFAAAIDGERKQREEHGKLRDKISTQVFSCANSRIFVERFPELARYVPEDPEEPINLPATSDLIDSLKAAGLEVDKVPEPA